MPDEQERRSPKRRTPRAQAGRNAPAQTGVPLASTPDSDRTEDPADPREPVDFRAAAQRLTARAAQIAELKADVQRGTYRADADETAKAMERRSDA